MDATTETPAEPQIRVHEKFPKTETTDLLVQSSDGVQFYLHRKNLEVNTEAFPGCEFEAPADEVTHLTETAEVLAIIFAFVYPRKYPKLNKMDYDLLGPVAEAIEKYRVFPAMHACEARLIQLVSKHPTQILLHAIKHDYPDLVDLALPHFARKDLVEVAQLLPPHYMLPWCRYHEAWDNVFRDTLQYFCTNPYTRDGYGRADSNYFQQDLTQITLWRDMKNLDTLRDAVSTAPDLSISGPCPECTRQINMTQRKYPTGKSEELAGVCKAKIDAIPPFTTFLRSENT